MSALYKKYLFQSLFVTFLVLAISSCGGGGGSDSGATTDSGGSSTTLGSVGGLTVASGDGQNVISWTAVEGAMSYNLYWEIGATSRTTAKAADCTGDSFAGITDTFYTHTGLTNGTNYNYNTTAVDGSGAEGGCNGSSASGSPTDPTDTSVAGCTDSSANNYNPKATESDGSCTYTVNGCTDSSANNYSPNANEDDGSCTYDSGGSGGGSTPTCPPGFVWDGNGCI